MKKYIPPNLPTIGIEVLSNREKSLHSKMKPFLPLMVYSSLYKTESSGGMSASMLQGDAAIHKEYDPIPNSIPQIVRGFTVLFSFELSVFSC